MKFKILELSINVVPTLKKNEQILKNLKKEESRFDF